MTEIEITLQKIRKLEIVTTKITYERVQVFETLYNSVDYITMIELLCPVRLHLT